MAKGLMETKKIARCITSALVNREKKKRFHSQFFADHRFDPSNKTHRSIDRSKQSAQILANNRFF
jgi:hypothetical protein